MSGLLNSVAGGLAATAPSPCIFKIAQGPSGKMLVCGSKNDDGTLAGDHFNVDLAQVVLDARPMMTKSWIQKLDYYEVPSADVLYDAYCESEQGPLNVQSFLDRLRQVGVTVDRVITPPKEGQEWPNALYRFFFNLTVSVHCVKGAIPAPEVATLVGSTTTGRPSAKSPSGDTSISTRLTKHAQGVNVRNANQHPTFSRLYVFTSLLKRNSGSSVMNSFSTTFQAYEAMSLKDIKAKDWCLEFEDANTSMHSFVSLHGTAFFHLEGTGAVDLARRCATRLALSPGSGPGLAALLKAFICLLREPALQNDPDRQRDAYVHLVLVAEIAMENRADLFHEDPNDDPTAFEDRMQHALFVGNHPQFRTPLLTREESTMCLGPAPDAIQSGQVPSLPAPPKALPVKSYATKQAHTKDLKTQEKTVEELRSTIEQLQATVAALQGQSTGQQPQGAPPVGQPAH